MKSGQIRQQFLDYFAGKGHECVPSSPLIPANDPTLLFTNAGMVQFKEVFLGLEKRDYSRAASAQRCVRAGGKHNDLENVGYTERHHTFFEMLGNFSFGDYFKREAIHFAWEFLTDILKIPEQRLWVSIFHDDEEAAAIWLDELKIDPKRFSRCGDADNFWSMGDTGPCGPCTEIFYDHGEEVAGGPPGTPEQEGDRYVEIWNLVFMQYDRSAAGEMMLLPKPAVDTGMGLERITAVMQGVHSNYETDLFQPLMRATSALTDGSSHSDTSLKVIADHIRSCAFLIMDGVTPSNEGRGYVLRRIIRRAVRHGAKLAIQEPFFYRLVQPLIAIMGSAYPELIKAEDRIVAALLREEEQFAKTLAQGLTILQQDLVQLDTRVIPGETIFELYDTYGFPIDLTADVAREQGFKLDMVGFEKAMAQQRARSQAASQFDVDQSRRVKVDAQTEFSGYESLSHNARVQALLREAETVETLQAGDQGAVVLERTPFYAEAGGQVGDSGKLIFADGEFVVQDTQKSGQAYVHYGRLASGALHVGDTVEAQVDMVRRTATMLNHTATHLLHAALRQILGEHVLQKGSLVAPDRLRFDFTHYEAVTAEQLVDIEDLVNAQIRANYAAETDVMSPEAARQAGALALFGEKYGEKVRVLSLGDFSRELCGGTHVARTGDIGFFKITASSGIAAGTRRIEAVTGGAAIKWQQDVEKHLANVAHLLKTEPQQVEEKIRQLLASQRKLEKDLVAVKASVVGDVTAKLVEKAQKINGVSWLVAEVRDADMKSLRHSFDQLKNKLEPAVIVLYSIDKTAAEERLRVVAGMSKSCTGKGLQAADLVVSMGVSGGGRVDMAQGGGVKPTDPGKHVEQTKEKIRQFLDPHLEWEDD